MLKSPPPFSKWMSTVSLYNLLPKKKRKSASTEERESGNSDEDFDGSNDEFYGSIQIPRGLNMAEAINNQNYMDGHYPIRNYDN